MIEVATGVAFLMTSLYGVGHANANTGESIAVKNIMGAAPIVRDFKNPKEIEKFLRQEFMDSAILVDIARCESTFRQYDDKGMVVRGRVNKADVGVMQINEMYHAETAIKLGIDIYSVEGNVAFGKYLYKKYGTSPWSASSKCWSPIATLAEK